MTKPSVLVVDDALEMAQTVAEYLGKHGFETEVANTGEQAVARFKAAPTDAVLTDLRMKEMDGLDVLSSIHRVDPHVPVVIMTAFGAVDSAVEAIQRGAYHYVTKPFKLDVVRLLLRRAVDERLLRSENEVLKTAVRTSRATDTLIGRSAQLARVTDLVARVAAAASPVLVLGETGTGKELVARAIHAAGPRAGAPFVAVNCAALPESLLESELFGHTRGAFTGATQTRRGLFLEADSGTLLLDEIGDMPLALQAKLLRVIQTGEVRAVGSDGTRSVDVRIIAATNRVLVELVRDAAFREDLYFRLNVVPIQVPPLRDRQEDVPLLANHFLKRSREQFPSSRVASFAPRAMQALLSHTWPGNVRELENLVERCVITGAESEIEESLVRESIDAILARDPLSSAQRDMPPLHILEQRYIAWVMEKVGNNKTRASEILGIDPSTIYRREKQGKA